MYYSVLQIFQYFVTHVASTVSYNDTQSVYQYSYYVLQIPSMYIRPALYCHNQVTGFMYDKLYK